jgi:2-methylcitrate dehydratase PrpD
LKSVTESFANLIHGLKVGHLTDDVIHKSKRMILDTLGVGFLGTSTEVFHKVSQYSKVRSSKFIVKIKNKCACTPSVGKTQRVSLCSVRSILSFIDSD